jgi:hypothetical protein
MTYAFPVAASVAWRTRFNSLRWLWGNALRRGLSVSKLTELSKGGWRRDAKAG